MTGILFNTRNISCSCDLCHINRQSLGTTPMTNNCTSIPIQRHVKLLPHQILAKCTIQSLLVNRILENPINVNCLIEQKYIDVHMIGKHVDLNFKINFVTRRIHTDQKNYFTVSMELLGPLGAKPLRGVHCSTVYMSGLIVFLNLMNSKSASVRVTRVPVELQNIQPRVIGVTYDKTLISSADAVDRFESKRK
ncbi:hypothetical protein AGLY_004193 [Aphis glycines]|uniref:Uncharacterized protein n=1 Tax=Aphis glycines TaxID=307491 RepID=A0A6G0TXS4_APHGL|nr:hypothetical protein AGLY_004193 [Aphis glycines]